MEAQHLFREVTKAYPPRILVSTCSIAIPLGCPHLPGVFCNVNTLWCGIYSCVVVQERELRDLPRASAGQWHLQGWRHASPQPTCSPLPILCGIASPWLCPQVILQQWHGSADGPARGRDGTEPWGTEGLASSPQRGPFRLGWSAEVGKGRTQAASGHHWAAMAHRSGKFHLQILEIYKNYRVREEGASKQVLTRTVRAAVYRCPLVAALRMAASVPPYRIGTSGGRMGSG